MGHLSGSGRRLRRVRRNSPAIVVLGTAVALGLPDALGLETFAWAYGRPQNLRPLMNMVVLALGAGLLSVVLGVPLVWATLYRTESRPFPRPASGRIAVKVINHYGGEVMRVFRAD